MKNNIDAFIRDSLQSIKSLEYLQSLENSSTPSKEQKDILLEKVLLQSKTQNISSISRFKNTIFINPWRFALGASAFQAIVLTAIFGSKYTNLFFEFLGR
jgi:hypothetical protein